jgi:hypothetical protein
VGLWHAQATFSTSERGPKGRGTPLTSCMRVTAAEETVWLEAVLEAREERQDENIKRRIIGLASSTLGRNDYRHYGSDHP